MKTKMIFLILVIFTRINLIQSAPFQPAGTDDPVQKAFNLRMKGKIDEARSLLEKTLSKDSSNAMAWYELARLNHYTFTGQSNVTPDDIRKQAERAVMLEPKNVTYSYFYAISSFMKAFMAMQQQDQEKIKSLLSNTCDAFEKVLTLKPDYHEATLYLVDIYGCLPPDMGGDSLKAAGIIKNLESQDMYFGAKARAAVLPEDADRVKFWESKMGKDQSDPRLLTEIGIAFLFKDDPAKAEEYFNKAMKQNASFNYLFLDIARYHMYKVMRNKELAKTEIPLSIKYLDAYLETKPTPVVPLKAYALGLKSNLLMFLGEKEQAGKILGEAKATDPYFSRASGIPLQLLFDAPDKISYHYFSFFSPY